MYSLGVGEVSVRVGSPRAPDQRLINLVFACVSQELEAVLPAEFGCISHYYKFNRLSLVYLDFSMSLCVSLSLLVFLSLFTLACMCT